MVQAWKDIENFLHGDRSALRTNSRPHQQPHDLTSLMTAVSDVDVDDQLTMTSPEYNDFTTLDGQASFADVTTASGFGMFPGHGEPAGVWEGCFTPPVSPTGELVDMEDVYDDEFDFILHPSSGAESAERGGRAAAELYGSAEPGVAPVLLSTCAQQDYFDSYYPPVSAQPTPPHVDWYATATYGTPNDQRSFTTDAWRASCDCAQCRIYSPAMEMSSCQHLSSYHHHHQHQQQQQQYTQPADSCSQYMSQYRQQSTEMFYDVNVASQRSESCRCVGVTTPPVSPSDLATTVDPAAAAAAVQFNVRYDTPSGVWAGETAAPWSDYGDWRHDYQLDDDTSALAVVAGTTFNLSTPLTLGVTGVLVHQHLILCYLYHFRPYSINQSIFRLVKLKLNGSSFLVASNSSGSILVYSIDVARVGQLFR